MQLALDHLVIMVEDLDLAVTEYQQRGFTVMGGGRHADGLTHNALIIFADTSYVELIAFLDPQATDDNVWGWRQYTRRGGGLIDYCVAVDNLALATAAMNAKGLSVTEPSAGGRITAGGDELRWRSARFWQTGRELPFLIEDVTPRSLRVPSGASKHPNGVIGIQELIVAVADVQRVAVLMAKLLDCPMPSASLNRRYDARTASFTFGQHTLTLAAPDNASSPLQQRITSIGLGPAAVTWNFGQVSGANALPATQTWFGPAG